MTERRKFLEIIIFKSKEMGGVWGNKIKLSIFGESHGEGIGIVIDGIEPGIKNKYG